MFRPRYDALVFRLSRVFECTAELGSGIHSLRSSFAEFPFWQPESRGLYTHLLWARRVADSSDRCAARVTHSIGEFVTKDDDFELLDGLNRAGSAAYTRSQRILQDTITDLLLTLAGSPFYAQPNGR